MYIVLADCADFLSNVGVRARRPVGSRDSTGDGAAGANVAGRVRAGQPPGEPPDALPRFAAGRQPPGNRARLARSQPLPGTPWWPPRFHRLDQGRCRHALQLPLVRRGESAFHNLFKFFTDYFCINDREVLDDGWDLYPLGLHARVTIPVD